MVPMAYVRYSRPLYNKSERIHVKRDEFNGSIVDMSFTTAPCGRYLGLGIEQVHMENYSKEDDQSAALRYPR